MMGPPSTVSQYIVRTRTNRTSLRCTDLLGSWTQGSIFAYIMRFASGCADQLDLHAPFLVEGGNPPHRPLPDSLFVQGVRPLIWSEALQ